MKLFSILCFFVYFATNSYAQSVRLDTMAAEARNEYLTRLAKEVTLAFGPGFYRDSVVPDISTVKVFFSSNWGGRDSDFISNDGRKYYTVTFPTKESLEWNYTSEVDIWEDDGQPQKIMFGTGIGLHFMVTGKSYKEWLEQGIKESDQFPYRTRPIIDNPFKQSNAVCGTSHDSIVVHRIDPFHYNRYVNVIRNDSIHERDEHDGLMFKILSDSTAEFVNYRNDSTIRIDSLIIPEWVSIDSRRYEVVGIAANCLQRDYASIMGEPCFTS